MIKPEEPKRFDNWLQVDCNECGRYWDNTCDGVKCDTNSDKGLQGSTRLCNSYLPVRKVVIPAQIKALEKRCERLRKSNILIAIVIILHLFSHIMGWE